MIKSLEEVARGFVEPLLGKPEDLEIKIALNEESGFEEIFLTVAKEDMGRVVGREGKNIHSIRTLISAVAAKSQRKVHTEVIEKQ